MRKITVKVDRKKAENLEKINYELSFTKDIIQRIIESHQDDPDIINGETFRNYQKQGVDLQAEYNLAAAEVERLFIPEKLKGHKYRWIIPANSDEMTITILCNCKIEGIE